MTHILQRLFFDEVDTVYLAKITANVQKNMNPASFGADFLYDENIDHNEKKAQNSESEWARIHGQIEVLRLQIVFFKYLCTSYLGEIFVTFGRGQLVPFLLLVVSIMFS